MDKKPSPPYILLVGKVKEDEFQEELNSYSVYLKRSLLLRVDFQLMLMTNKNVQRLEDKSYLRE
jgi:hypothetical protein